MYNNDRRVQWHADERRKRDVYAALGVREYFLYDPRAEYLVPALQGWRLHDGEYGAMPAVTMLSNRGVAVASEVLGLELRDEREARRLHDRLTGEDLLTYEEAEQARGEAEQDASRARADAGRAREEAERVSKEQSAARRAAEGRAAELEARLRALEGRLEPPDAP